MKLRVAYLLPAPGIPAQGPSGSSAHARGLVAALRERHEVRFHAARLTDRRGRFGEVASALESGVPGWPSWLEGYRDITEIIAARRIARRVIEEAHTTWRPHVVIERHSLFSDAGWRIHERLRVPWLLEVNAPLWEERRRFEQLRRPEWARGWEQEVLLAAPVIAAVSRWLVAWLQEEVGCQDVRWVPNGVTPRLGSRSAGRVRLGIPEGVPVVGFVGSMKPWHGVERLPRIARALGARLALIGAGADALATEGAIVTGHLDEDALADVVAALDLGLAPYPADAPPWFCPLKILDYRAQGTPVVATDVGDCRPLVGDGGAVVPPDDEDALIDAARVWLGRRIEPSVRSWRMVSQEMLRAALPRKEAATRPPAKVRAEAPRRD